MAGSCRPRQLGETAQRSFGFAAEHGEGRAAAGVAGEARFVEDSPHGIFVGDERLESYLKAADMGWVLRLRQLLEQADLSALTRAYSGEGRRAIHPRALLGLIIYGMLQRQWSLRELQGLARRDVGAWWICGGQQPDHSTIGKFVQLHSEVLSEEFFTQLVGELVRKLKLGAATVGGDGTIIEAAGAKLRRLKLEAAQAAAAAAGGDAAANAEAVAALGERAAQDRARGRGDGKVSLCTSEPTAVVQPCKDGRVRAAYKPSILVHEAGLIVSQYVHPCSEPAAIGPLLAQHQQVFGAAPASLLLDAGYNGIGVLQQLVSAGIDALIPAGKVIDGNWEKPHTGGHFPKTAFRYDDATDRYHCPGGRTLGPAGRGKARGTRPAFRIYRSADCRSCPLLARCTTSPRGRTLHRYDGEEVRDAMAAVLAQPRARAHYRQRGRIVEPAFAELKRRQGLTRFHRRGPRGVRVEFALHCIAFNLKKAVSRPAGLLFALIVRLYAANQPLAAFPVAIVRISAPGKN